MSVGFGVCEVAEADQGAGEVQEGEHRGHLAVVTQAEPAERHDPGQTALHDPSEATEALAGVHAASSDARGDPTLPQRLPQVG